LCVGIYQLKLGPVTI